MKTRIIKQRVTSDLTSSLSRLSSLPLLRLRRSRTLSEAEGEGGRPSAFSSLGNPSRRILVLFFPEGPECTCSWSRACPERPQESNGLQPCTKGQESAALAAEVSGRFAYDSTKRYSLTAPILELRNVSYRVNAKNILSGITLGLRAGEVLALLGESGAGKTTVLLLANRLLTESTGEVLVRNRAAHVVDFIALL